MAKGSIKRAQSHFKRGHPVRSPKKPMSELKPRTVVRLNESEFSNVVETTPKGDIVTRDATGQAIECMLLRPGPEEESFYGTYDSADSLPQGQDNTYILVHRGKILNLFNSSFQEHKIHSPGCTGAVEWAESSSEQRGICWSMAVRCTECTYVSASHKLYNEVPGNGRGRRAAAPNVGLQVGLSRQGIGYSGFADILHSINTPSPSVSGMLKTANKVNPLIEEANREDMSKRITRLQALNTKRGLCPSAGISVEADATYNNKLSSGVGKTPTQPATRVSYLMSENMTNAKQIISAEVYCTLCSCKGGHKKNCTANLAKGSVIGDEARYLKGAIKKVSGNGGPRVAGITLDGDSNAQAAARETGATTYTCTRHLTRRNCLKIKQTAFSKTMFPGRLKAEKDDNQKRFALDLSERCQAEVQMAAETYPGEINSVAKSLEYVPDAIIGCYKGDHRLCHEYSLVCKKKKPWSRSFLKSCDGHTQPNTTFLTPTEKDIERLRECMDMRFGAKAIEKTYLNRTQNKSEAANRGLSKSLPKHMEFRRNARGRVHAAVHSMNNQPGTSLLKLCQVVGSPVSRGSKVVRQLKAKDKTVQSDKKRQASQDFKTGRAKRRKQTYTSYDQAKSEKCYKKGGFLTETRTADYKVYHTRRSQSHFTTSVEHGYAKNERLEQIERERQSGRDKILNGK